MAEINISLFNKRRTAELAARIREVHDQIEVAEPALQKMAEDVEQTRALADDISTQITVLDEQLVMAENIKADIEARVATAKKPTPISVKKKVRKLDITAVVILAVAAVALGALALTYFFISSENRDIIFELICVGGAAMLAEIIIGIVRSARYKKITRTNRASASEYEKYVSKQRVLLDEQIMRIGQFGVKREELVAELAQAEENAAELIKKQALSAKDCENLKTELARLYADCIPAPDYRNIDFADFLATVLRSDLIDSIRDAIFLYEKNNRYNELMAKLDRLIPAESEE